MFRRVLAFLFAFYISLSPVITPAEEYRWVDEKGVLHFSDNPPPENLKSKPPLIEEAKPALKEEPQSPVPEAKSIEKVKLPKKRVAKKVVVRTEAPVKLYDIRGEVAHIEGVDTIVLSTGEKIKYIGVRDPSAFLAKNGLSRKMEEVLKFHKKLVKGKTVTVLLGRQKQDKKGHYLGHVFLGQQAFVNAELVRKGFAMTEEYPSDFEYQALFIRLQRDAQEKGLGIWNY